eukprot:223095-Amorphochlora_amoeboformis.AAC.1
MDNVLAIIDSVQPVIAILNSSIGLVDNATAITHEIDAVVSVMTNASALIRGELDTIHGNGNFVGWIPLAGDIPQVDSDDLLTPTGLRVALDSVG